MGITEVSIIHHVCIILLLLWLLSSFNCCHPVAYFISLVYLYLVHDRYVMRLRRNIQFEERRQANQRRVLSDSETVRWLNHAVEKIWPVCMEHIVSQKVLLPIVPWFLQKYKPWTVKDAVVQHMYMGRSPPMFTEMRVLHHSSDDDHLILELGMNFHTADDMSAILAVKLRRRLGLGMWAKLHLTGMHVEGKVLVGVKFLRGWPFISRLRVCFVEPPYFQMTVKPLVAHGLDVTELPGIAGWLDKLLGIVFEQTLVEPNMLVVDVEKFVSPEPENWFSVDAKDPIAHALVEVVEASDMRPADMNGLSDPYVKGHLGQYRFRTKTQRKTLSPKWLEEFKVPICTWDSPNVLTIEVRDKDHLFDDSLGDCSISINDLRDGQRHDMRLSLQNVKTGRLHLAITVIEGEGKVPGQPNGREPSNEEYTRTIDTDSNLKEPLSSAWLEKSQKVADKFEPIDIEGQDETGIWVHRPGTEVAIVWEPRKGKSRLLDTQIEGMGSFESSVSASYQNDASSSDESQEGEKPRSRNPVRKGLKKISSVFRRNNEMEDKSSSIEVPLPSPHDNIMEAKTKDIGVKFIVEDNSSTPGVKSPKVEGYSMEGGVSESPGKGNVKVMTKSILKHAGNSARGLKHALSRKGSKNSKGQPGPVLTSRDISVRSDTSNEESLTSPVYKPQDEANSVLPNTISGSGKYSLNSDEHTIQGSSTDLAVNIPIEKTRIEDFSGGATTLSTSRGNVDALVEEQQSPSSLKMGVDK